MALLEELRALVKALEKQNEKIVSAKGSKEMAEKALQTYKDGLKRHETEIQGIQASSNGRLKSELQAILTSGEEASATPNGFIIMHEEIASLESKGEVVGAAAGNGRLSTAIDFLTKLNQQLNTQISSLLASEDIASLKSTIEKFETAFASIATMANSSSKVKGGLARTASFRGNSDKDELGSYTQCSDTFTTTMKSLKQKFQALTSAAGAERQADAHQADAHQEQAHPADAHQEQQPQEQQRQEQQPQEEQRQEEQRQEQQPQEEQRQEQQPQEEQRQEQQRQEQQPQEQAHQADAHQEQQPQEADLLAAEQARLADAEAARAALDLVTFVDENSPLALQFTELKEALVDPSLQNEPVVVNAMRALFAYCETLSRGLEEGADQAAIGALIQARHDARIRFQNSIVNMPGHPNELVQNIGKAFMAVGTLIAAALVASPLVALVSISAAAAIALPAACVIPAAVTAATLVGAGVLGFFGAGSSGAHRKAQELAASGAALDNQTTAVINIAAGA